MDNSDLSPRPTPPMWNYPAMLTVCVFSILLPRGKLRLICGIILVQLFLGVLWGAQSTVQAYALANQTIMLLLRWIDLMIIHDPEKDFWRVENPPKEKGDDWTPSGTKTVNGTWTKLKWWTVLLINQRGVGLNIQSKGIPASVPRDYPNGRWLRERLVRTLFFFVLTDLVTSILAGLPNDQQFFDQSLSLQIFSTWLHIGRFCWGTEMSYNSLAFISVLFHFGGPSDWPPLFGLFWRDGYTVRNVWGKCWHQWLRRNCSTAGKLVTRFLGFKERSLANGWTQIWVAFAVSALIHQLGALASCFEDHGFWQATFFLSQPLGIAAETLAKGAGKSVGIKQTRWTEVLGFVWVILWFSYTARWMMAFQPVAWLTEDRPPSIVDFAAGLVKSCLSRGK